jgi:hypothetical protein
MKRRSIGVRSLIGVIAIAALIAGAFEAGRRYGAKPELRRITVVTRNGENVSSTTEIYDLRNPQAPAAYQRQLNRLRADGAEYVVTRPTFLGQYGWEAHPTAEVIESSVRRNTNQQRR